MNQTPSHPSITPQQFSAMNLGSMQIPNGTVHHSDGQQAQNFHPSTVPGLPPPINNSLTSDPSFVGPQLQTMLQMHMLQQQQNQLAMTGFFHGMGVATPYSLAPPLNLGALPSLSLQRFYPGPVPAPLGIPNTFSSADDELLAHVIHEDKGKKNLNESLHSLNGMNHHTTEQWTDYYMRNSSRIDRLNTTHGSTPGPSDTTPLTPLTAPVMKSTKMGSKSPPQSGNKSRSQRMATRANAKPSTSSRLRANLDRYQLRSPTPPTSVVRLPGGRSKYTEEDIAFFKKFLAFTLRQDASALDNVSGFVDRLARRARHHTAASWRAWLSDNDHIMQSVTSEVLGGARASSEPESVTSGADRGKSHEPEPDHNSEIEIDEADVSLSSSESEGETRAKDAIASQGKRRIVYLPSEKRALAKSIAEVTLAKWKPRGPTGNKFWRKISAKHNNTHSHTAWRDWYFRNKSEMRHIAKRFEIRNAKRKRARRKAIPIHISSSCSAGPSAPQKCPLKEDVDDDGAPYECQIAKRSKSFTDMSQVNPIKLSSSPEM